jgi:hypothetical protein
MYINIRAQHIYSRGEDLVTKPHAAISGYLGMGDAVLVNPNPVSTSRQEG